MRLDLVPRTHAAREAETQVCAGDAGDAPADVAVRGDGAAKRMLDIVGALALLALLAPLLLVVAAAVRLSGPGPILFRQARHGRGGHVFRIYKFRTMRGAAPSAAAIGDPSDHAARVTRVGHWLRRYCLDELPQLLNVLTGDMSLVGPRAHPVDLHVRGVLYETVVPEYHSRHAVRPGMTGLAQVSGFHGIVDGPEHARQRVAHDLLYIRARSLPLDLALILFTAWRFLVRGGEGERPFPIARFLRSDAPAASIADGRTGQEPDRPAQGPARAW